MNELAYFAGAGGGILGGIIEGARTVCAVERDAYAATVLAQRQTDGHLPLFPIWSDAATFDPRPYAGIINLVSGGFPCQDISSSGTGAGIDGTKSSAWYYLRDTIRILVAERRNRGQLAPELLLENSPMLTLRGLDRVLGELATLGYNAEWDVFGAHHLGAPHRRDRIWILAHSSSQQNQRRERGDMENQERSRQGFDTTINTCGENVANSMFSGLERFTRDEHRGDQSRRIHEEQNRSIGASSIRHPAEQRPPYRRDLTTGPQPGQFERPDWWAVEPQLGRVANGVAHRVDRLKAIGNGQVPAVAAFAYRTLRARFK